MGKVNKRTRDAGTGRFVPDGEEDKRPDTTMREVTDSPASRRGKIARTVIRDTVTGQFLPRRAASKRPDTTIEQTIYCTVLSG